MNLASRRMPVNTDASLSRALESIIGKLRDDDTVRKANPTQQAGRKAQMTAQCGDAEVAERQLERILQGNDLTDINYLAIGLQRARAVGRVVIRQNRRLLGYGTGFLVAPGVMLTNQHVLETVEMVQESTVQFQYERSVQGLELEPIEFQFRLDPRPIIYKQLDFALTAVEPLSRDRQSLHEFGWLKLNPAPGKAFVGEYLTIIQHPGGQRKQVCVRENKLLKYDDSSPLVWYQTDTVGGSSGSPAFNTTWDVVALHHSSVPRIGKVNGKDVWLRKDGTPWKEGMSDDDVDWIANEGVRISMILDYLAQSHPDHPLSLAVRSTEDPPVHESFLSNQEQPTGGIRVFKDRTGRTKVILPVEIDINTTLDAGLLREAPAAVRSSVASLVKRTGMSVIPKSGSAVEKVEINTENYPQRNGYQSDFLGGGLEAPLPKVDGDEFGKPLKISGNKTELKYWNYSVIMNADRGLAFFCAGNIMPKERKGSQDGNQFIRDKRVDAVDEKAQIGEAFYKKQSTFEAEDRSKNPFDQGHLSRREDLQWGPDAAIAKRNGDDSYHYTNCAPQHFQFNQNRKISGLWNRLEVSAIETLSIGEKLCIINGPVFNAPKSQAGPDGKLLLQLDGTRTADPTFGGVRIPKLYFKLIAYRDQDKLKAKAFVVSQEDVLKTVNKLHVDEASTLSDKELSLYQVKIKDLEKLTGLKFGIPATADTPHVEELALLEGGRPIFEEEELFLGR